ncbi:MAG: DNA circularization N-terminal domain-containing protein, partial [Sneathiella sp.]
MSWRDNLQPASYKTVAFEVTSHDLDTGRRGPVHEYPGRDKPMAEDLGRKAREFTIEGFVIGDDWHKKRDALIAKCEEEGPGKLVHPFFGSMQVENRGCRVSESSKEGRVARFSLTFVEAGENTFPTSSVNTAAAVESSSKSLKDAAASSLEDIYSVAKRPAFVADSTEDLLGDMLASISKADLTTAAI